MPRWNNFQIWRGRLPHWRADDVTYYVTFKHKRPLDDTESQTLFRRLLSADAKKLDFVVLSVTAEITEAIFRVNDAPKGGKYELSDVIEKAKLKAGKDITKKSGERWPPFYHESYDRIIRDDAEFEDTLLKILDATEQDHPTLYLPN